MNNKMTGCPHPEEEGGFALNVFIVGHLMNTYCVQGITFGDTKEGLI